MNERTARLLVRERSGGDCEIRTPWCRGRATNWSHRRARGQGGLWTPSNGIDVCGMGNATGCHGYLHQHADEARTKGWVVSAWGADPMGAPVELHTVHYGHSYVLLDDAGCYALAPWPPHPAGHPDDLPTRGVA